MCFVEFEAFSVFYSTAYRLKWSKTRNQSSPRRTYGNYIVIRLKQTVLTWQFRKRKVAEFFNFLIESNSRGSGLVSWRNSLGSTACYLSSFVLRNTSGWTWYSEFFELKTFSAKTFQYHKITFEWHGTFFRIFAQQTFHGAERSCSKLPVEICMGTQRRSEMTVLTSH